MIGWTSTLSNDYSTHVENGAVDDDLERIKGVIERRLRIVAGEKLCPICNEFLEFRKPHDHDGIIVRAETTNRRGTK